MKKRYSVIVLCGALLLLAQGFAFAQPFELVGNTQTVPAPPGTGVHGIALVGDTWCMGNFEFGGWNVYDLDFNQTGTVAVSPAIGTVRGLCYDSNAGTMFVGEYSAQMIHETTTAGVILNSFPTTVSGFNALAFNPTNDHIYAVGYQGAVEEMTRTGGVVNSWGTSYNWTGAACDWVNETLLLMEGADQVLEFDFDGNYVDTPIPGDCVTDNGQGLHYDALTGLLHADSQYGNIGIWQRAVVTAIESTSWGSLKAMY